MRFLRGGREGEGSLGERMGRTDGPLLGGGVLEDGGSEGSAVGRLPVRTGGTVAGPEG